MDEKELIGNMNTYSKLFGIWYILTDLMNNKLRIFKEDYGMDRTLEEVIHRILEHIPEMRNDLEYVMKKIKEKITSNLRIYGFN